MWVVDVVDIWGLPSAETLYIQTGDFVRLPFLNPTSNPTITLALPLDSKCSLIQAGV